MLLRETPLHLGHVRSVAAVTAAGAHWVDVTGLSREPHDDWLAADGLHPSAAQYAQWAARALPAARAALGY